MKKMYIFLLALGLFFTQGLLAQSNETESSTTEEAEKPLSFNIDLNFPYVWRGGVLNSNKKLAFQPSLSYTISDKWSATAWYSTNFSSGVNAYNEFDVYLAYAASDVFTAQLGYYYFPITGDIKKAGGERSGFFDLKNGGQNALDLSLLFDLSAKGTPIDFQLNTLIMGGADKKENGDQGFATYGEVGYSLASGGLSIRPFIGAAFINESGFYGVDKNGEVGFNLCNLGVQLSYDIPVGEVSIPIRAQYNYNQFGTDAVDDGKLNHHVFSVGTSYSF